MVRPDARLRPVGKVLRPVPSLAEMCSYPAEVEGPVDTQCAWYGPATLSELQTPRFRVNPGTATRQAGPDVDGDAP